MKLNKLIVTMIGYAIALALILLWFDWKLFLVLMVWGFAHNAEFHWNQIDNNKKNP